MTGHDDPLASPDRHRGHASAPRHRGVYHAHRRRGWHPHPHEHAARRRAEQGARTMAAPGPGAPLVWAPPAPLHHHQHQPSARHVPGPRGAQTVTELGQIAAYDAGSGTAMVRMRGAPARLLGPTRVTACTPRDLTLVGASCLVVLLDQHNPADGVVVAVWPAADGQTDARLTQAGVAEVGVAGTTEASLVAPFPRAYMGAPIVVATASDPAWAATVTGATATGFTLTIRSGAPATGTVAVSWIACGV